MSCHVGPTLVFAPLLGSGGRRGEKGGRARASHRCGKRPGGRRPGNSNSARGLSRRRLPPPRPEPTSGTPTALQSC
eukprot:240802-Alexandrium_andersonii.AAC.1